MDIKIGTIPSEIGQGKYIIQMLEVLKTYDIQIFLLINHVVAWLGRPNI